MIRASPHTTTEYATGLSLFGTEFAVRRLCQSFGSSGGSTVVVDGPPDLSVNG